MPEVNTVADSLADESIKIVNKMIEEIQNQKNLALCDEIFSEKFINFTPLPQFSKDREGMKQLFSSTFAAFPDGELVVNDQISNNSKVWTRKTFSGTNLGELGGRPATGKKISYEDIDILTVENSKITQHWSVVDRFSIYQQLGII